MNLKQKTQEEKEHPEDIFFIKTGFQKGVKEPVLREILREHVYSMSQIAHLGSLVFNKFLKQVLETQPDLLETFHFESYSKCQNLMGYVFKILTLDSRRQTEEELKVPEPLKAVAQEFTNTFQVPKLQRLAYDSQLLKYTYKKYYVNFHNYLWCSFDGKQKRYIRQFLEMNKLEAKEWMGYILYEINNWKKPSENLLKPQKKKKLKCSKSCLGVFKNLLSNKNFG